MESRVSEPIYKQIALDIAGRIYNEDIKVGDKISGRSTLASNYNVSPETIRKAIKLLEDMDVVISSRGSGINIISKQNAYEFINRFHSIESVTTLKQSIDSLLEEKQVIEKNISDMIEKIVDYSNRLRYTNPLTPIEVEIPDNSDIIGKSISEAKFWQNTGATIVGVRRNGELNISPGPYFTFKKNDVILVVGEEKIFSAINKYFNKNIL
ncbi:TrkA C-terminal domain-containing protein [Clostridium tarantellae]|uniref:GntR family transcriptional regulator n=1 Tax=Clostridium tarantellae TaxID=39493 RepID=A0A6I1MNL1_9CLOT|nr:TrkA C-terminal domain-containing protein [Clostridium tarantellae]MPQ43852.1 GntR family transcriptional regulator [Clostridium tarantellae]